jgi:hypothetical protein
VASCRSGEEVRMTRSLFWALTAGLLGSALNHAAAEPSPIATSMGDLRWGLSETEVASFAKRKLGEQYNGEIAKTKDSSKQGKLRSELKQAQADVGKSLVNFSAGHSKWDNSPIAGEFTYGNSESMLMSKAPNAQDFYFFVDGRLWKWCEVLDKAAIGGDFKKFSQTVESKFGKGRVKKGEVTPGHGNTQWLEYLDRNSRLRAADNDGKRNGYTLIYEEMATVRQLASTRPVKPTRLGGAADDDASEIKSSLPKAQKAGASEEGQIAKGPSKRSLFAGENQNESEGEYEARKQKTALEARDRQQHAHDRKEESKKGEALKQLDGLNDSDPLGGL